MHLDFFKRFKNCMLLKFWIKKYLYKEAVCIVLLFYDKKNTHILHDEHLCLFDHNCLKKCTSL